MVERFIARGRLRCGGGGGLLFGALQPRRPPAQLLPRIAAGLAVGTLLPVLAPGTIVLGVIMFALGSAVAPYSTVNSLLLGQSAPTGTTTEAFAWNTTMIFGGSAIGSALAGVLIDAHGARAGFALTALSGVVLLTASLTGRRHLAAGASAPVA